MLFKKKFIEKRRHQRLDYYCLVKYRPLYHKGEYREIVTSLRNLSSGGILLKLKDWLPQGSELEVKLNITQLKESLVATAKVVRVSRQKSGEGYWCGVEFLAMSEEDKKRLTDFISALKNKSTHSTAPR
jgi:c-di-GMP-binding flagellar brake protein YcgR